MYITASLSSVQGYGNQEEDDLEGWGAGGGGEVGAKDKLSAKHKSRTISINPTEGFQYSDVYFVSWISIYMYMCVLYVPDSQPT